jgi:tyrosine-protein kinase Etk/Wzc
VHSDDFTINGKVGELIDEKGISLKIDEIDAKPGTEFTIGYVSRLKAITDLQEGLNVVIKERYRDIDTFLDRR